jgi:uncharacterized cupin superfamily protein
MNRRNLNTPELKFDATDPEGFRSGMDRPGPAMGAKATGLSLYELPPGQAICPYHYEYGEEEWLVVVQGNPTLRDPEGEHQLDVMDVVFFPRGPEGAHEVVNRSEETVRVLMFSDIVHPTATVYPDSDKIAIWTGNKDDDAIVPRSAKVEYFDGEPERG